MTRPTIAALILVIMLLVTASLYAGREAQTEIASPPELETYVNSTFGYELQYPKGAEVGYYGMADIPLEESPELVIGSPVIFHVNALGLNPKEPKEASLRRRAEAVREFQVSYDSQHPSDRKIGAFEETEFAGRPAYSFTLTDGYDSVHESYVLRPAGTPFLFVFVENYAGVPFMIQYPLGNETAELIAHSFTFTPN